MNKNIREFPKYDLKTKLRANDSYGKNKQRIITHKKPPNIGLNIQNEDIPLQSVKPIQTEMSLRERVNPLKKYERHNNINNIIKRTSYTAPKYRLLESRTPKREYHRTKLISNRLYNNNNTFYKTTEAFNDLYDLDIRKRYNINYTIRPYIRLKNRNYSRPDFHGIKTELDLNNESTYQKNNININRTNYIKDSIKDNVKLKELITMNNILNKQNTQLKAQIRELTFKLKEIKEKDIKLMKNNQYIVTLNKKLKINLNDKQKELKNLKEMSSTELDSQNSTIIKLNDQLNQMKNLLEEKEILISQLTNNNNNNQYNSNENLDQYANGINDLINQLNEMEKKNQNLNIEKEKNEQMFNQKINTLTQQNKEYLNIINNLKEEQAHNQNQIQNNFNDDNNNNEELQNKIIELENQYNQLLEEFNKKDNLVKKLIGEKNELIDENRRIIDLLKVDSKKMALVDSLRQIDSGEQSVTKNTQIITLTENNDKLKKEISNLQNKISILEKEKQNIIDNVNKSNLNIQNNQELPKQITLLKKENEKLQNQLMTYINSETSNNNKIKKILEEKSELLKENAELKNDIKEFENEKHKNALQLSKLSQLQKDFDNLKKENETNFEQMKLKQEENQQLYNIVKDKERENEYLKNQIGKKNEVEENDDYGVEMLNVEINNEIKEKNVIIDRLEKQIKILENTNEKITEENIQLKEKLQLIQGGKDEDNINSIVNLKDELEDKKKQIQKLIYENKNLRNKTKEINSSNNINNNINNEEEEKEIDLNNNNYNNNIERNPFRITMNSQGLTDADKIKLYKERIKEYEMMNESDKIQIKALKDDIKIMKEKIKNLETFGGQIKDINEFIYLLNLALISYKPKKQEQKDALNKIINVLNNFQGINLNK